MPAFVDVSGTWRHLIPYVNISGAWRQIPQIYINVNNTWRPLWTYSWSIGGWGTCSATCGGGTQTRTVTCIRSGDNRTFGDNVCTAFGAGTKPPTSQPCNTQSCISCKYDDNNFYSCSFRGCLFKNNEKKIYVNGVLLDTGALCGNTGWHCLCNTLDGGQDEYCGYYAGTYQSTTYTWCPGGSDGRNHPSCRYQVCGPL